MIDRGGDVPSFSRCRFTNANNSYLELNAAIIVSLAPAFTGFAQSHLPEMSIIKMFFSSLTSFASKTKNSESVPGSGFTADKMAPVDEENANHPHNHHSYEINELNGLQSGVTADQDGKMWAPSSPGLPEEGGIVRTLAFEQTIKSSAVYICSYHSSYLQVLAYNVAI